MATSLHASRSLSRRGVFWLVLLAAALPTAYYVQDQFLLVLTVALQEIIYQVVYLAPCYLLGRTALRRLAPAHVDTALGVASSAALGLGAVGLLTLALGLLGVLSTPIAWSVLAVAAVLGLLDARDLVASLTLASQRFRDWFDAPSSGGWLWLAAAMLMTIPLIGAMLLPGTLWRPDDPHPYDSLVYHLQIPREWYELGQVVALRHNVYSFFPFNVEMHYLLANHLRGGPWVAMHQNQFLSVSFTLLAAVGLWGFLKPLTGGRGAALAAISLLTLPWVLKLACVTYVESGMLLWSVLTLAWFFSALTDPLRRTQSFILAGIFCGLVCGTKLTGVPMLMFGLPLAGLLALAILRFPAITARQYILGCLFFGVVATVILSPWLIRNIAWAGNPVFPLAMEQLGQAHFSDVQVERWERAHQAAADHQAWSVRFTRLGTQIFLNWRFNYVLFPLALLALWFNRRNVHALTAAMLLLLMVLFWLAATHLMGRFFVLGIIPAAMLIAMLPARMLVVSGALVIAMAINSWIGFTLPLDQFKTARNLHMLFEHYAAQGRQGLYGLQDYSQIDPPELQQKIEFAREVVLVGDTQVFYRQFPMEKIRYCTVFDLNVSDDRDIIDAYYAPPPEKCPYDVLLLIDEPETRRLNRTYFQVPLVEEPSPGRVRDYVVIRP